MCPSISFFCILGLYLFISISVSFVNLNHSLTVGIRVLKEEKPKGSKVWSLKPQPTTMVDGDKNGDRTTFSGSCTTAKVKTSCQSSKKKEFNNLKDNLQCLWDNLVGECQHGPLSDQILLKCMDYITALSQLVFKIFKFLLLKGAFIC